MPRPGIQLYTLRDVDRPLPEVLELVADAGFEGVEFAYRVTEADPDAVVDALEETGLDVAGAHVGVDALEDDLDGTVAFHDDLGCEDIVIPWLAAECFASREAVEGTASRLSRLDDDLANEGKRLHYHNHDHEYVRLNGETGFDAFVDETDFGIELDVGFALLVGDDPVDRLRSLGERARLIHLKDVDADSGESVPVGRGDLDLSAVAETARDIDSDWLLYEYEGEAPLASLEDVGSTIRDLC